MGIRTRSALQAMGARPPTASESINYSFVPNRRSTMEALARSRLSAREFLCSTCHQRFHFTE